MQTGGGRERKRSDRNKIARPGRFECKGPMNRQFTNNADPFGEHRSPLIRQRWTILLAAAALTACTLLVLPLASELQPQREKKVIVRDFDTTVLRRPSPPTPPRMQPDSQSNAVAAVQSPAPPPPTSAELSPRAAAPADIPFNIDLPSPALTNQTNLTFRMAEKQPASTATGIQAPSAPRGVYGLDDLDSHPRPTTQIPPVYPYRARHRGQEGYVDVRFTVTKNGSVADIEVADAEPEAVFNDAARRAVAQWRFSPGIKNGNAVPTRLQMRIRFELED